MVHLRDGRQPVKCCSQGLPPLTWLVFWGVQAPWTRGPGFCLIIGKSGSFTFEFRFTLDTVSLDPFRTEFVKRVTCTCLCLLKRKHLILSRLNSEEIAKQLVQRAGRRICSASGKKSVISGKGWAEIPFMAQRGNFSIIRWGVPLETTRYNITSLIIAIRRTGPSRIYLSRKFGFVRQSVSYTYKERC